MASSLGHGFCRIGALLWVVTSAHSEVPQLYKVAEQLLGQGPENLPHSLARLPGIDAERERFLSLAVEDPGALSAQFLQWGKPLVDDSLRLPGGLGAIVF